jgi:hypothetical protein
VSYLVRADSPEDRVMKRSMEETIRIRCSPIQMRVNCGKEGGAHQDFLRETTGVRVVAGTKRVLIFGREDMTYGKKG